LITESIQNTTASGFAIDAGVQYRFSNALMIGIAVKNIGTNMEYSGPDLTTRTNVPGSIPGSNPGTYEIVAESFQIPSYFELSLTYAFNFNEQNNLSLAGAYTANNAFEDVANLGLEYGFMNTFFVRGGYNYLMENSDGYIYGFTFGAGIDYKMGGDVGFAFDYAFRDVKEFPNPMHIFTVKLAFQ
jgi:opacity protein-like surface antigen